jgi:mono/diheme cytochrome c family protein
MNDRTARGVVGVLVAVFALAALGFALAPRRDVAEGADGGRIWQQRCASCHTADEFLPRLRAADPVGAATRMLDQLADHGDAPLADDLLVVGWLVGQAGSAPAGEEPAPEDDDFTL